MKKTLQDFLSMAPAFMLIAVVIPLVAYGQFVTRDKRWPLRGPWLFSLSRELPEIYREFNAIDFGHAHIAETLLLTQDFSDVEKARLEVLAFIRSRPAVPPDEPQIAPVFTRMAWEAHKTFHWAHVLHRSLYDLFAADEVTDKEAVYRLIMDDYLSVPEAITSFPLDHHALWQFPESGSFHRKFPKFNTQIWAYHWLQSAVYDLQLMGKAKIQRELSFPVIEFYHRYLDDPPIEWEFMPMMLEVAPEFARRYPQAAAVFDNLHMLHDNINDVLASPDLFPTNTERRIRILELLKIYLHTEHLAGRYQEYRMPEHHFQHEFPGARPPAVQEVLGLHETKQGRRDYHHRHQHQLIKDVRNLDREKDGSP